MWEGMWLRIVIGRQCHSVRLQSCNIGSYVQCCALLSHYIADKTYTVMPSGLYQQRCTTCITCRITFTDVYYNEAAVLDNCLFMFDLTSTCTKIHCQLTQRKVSESNVRYSYESYNFLTSYCASFCNSVRIHLYVTAMNAQSVLAYHAIVCALPEYHCGQVTACTYTVLSSLATNVWLCV